MTQPIDWEKFEALSTEDQARMVHESSFKDKGDLILHSHDPQALTRSFSQEEFYLLTREMDPQERGEIVRYASVPQLLFCSDVECWKGDLLQPKEFMGWLETLKSAGDDVLLRWFFNMDYEAIVTGLKKIVRVVKPEREWPADEILGDTPYFTLDDFYYVAVNEEALETVKRALEVLYENDKGKYFAYLEGVMSEIDDPLEEEAYHLREVRLADRGFPDIERSYLIYSPITREEFEKFPLKNQKVQSAAADESGKKAEPAYLSLWGRERLFLDDVLDHLQGDAAVISEIHGSPLEGVQEELMWLTNKVLTVQGLDFSSEEKVRRGIERARHFVSIGLELLSEGDIGRAVVLARERWLETVFRWAVTQMADLRGRAETIVRAYWPHSKEQFLLFMNPPYQYLFRGLLRTVPQCYAPEIVDTEFPLRDFKTARDLERTELSLRTMEVFFRHFYTRFPRTIRSLHCEDENVRVGTTLFSLLGTIFAQTVLSKKNPTIGLDGKDLGRFLTEAFESKGAGRILKSSVKGNFLASFYKPEERSHLAGLWGFIFEAIEHELGGMKQGALPDMRYVSCVLKTRACEKA
jgi:hypothetical protein